MHSLDAQRAQEKPFGLDPKWLASELAIGSVWLTFVFPLGLAPAPFCDLNFGQRQR